MSDNKELNAEIKKVLSEEPGFMDKVLKVFSKFGIQKPAKKEELKFEKVSLKDGSELNYEGNLEVGTPVMVMDAEGKPSPAPDGSYETNDGTVIKVAEGKVSEIVAAAPPAPAVDMESVNASFAKLEARLSAQEKTIKDIKKENISLKKELETSNEDLSTISLAFEKVIKMPVVASVVKEQKSWSQMNNAEKTRFMRS